MTKEQYKREQWEIAMSFATHHGICASCGDQLKGGEFAHVIGQTKPNKKWFGWWFIHNAANGRATCSTSLGYHCNGDIDIGYSLEGREEHIKKVCQELWGNPHVPAHVVIDPVTMKDYRIKC